MKTSVSAKPIYEQKKYSRVSSASSPEPYLDSSIFFSVASAKFVVLQVSRQLGNGTDKDGIVKVNVFEAVRMCAHPGDKAIQVWSLVLYDRS